MRRSNVTVILLAGLICLLLQGPAKSQELEARAYSAAPVGLKFFVAGYAYSQGGLSTDPAVPIQDAKLRVHTTVFAYAQVLDLWGKSGKFDVILPYSDLAGSALVVGQPRERNVAGFNDPRFRLSVNFLGAPALSVKDFAGYKSDLVAGASVQVSAPVGQYDSSRVVNLGTNRWSVKPDIGFSKPFGPVTADVTAGVTFYGDNDNYFGGRRLERDRIYSVQAHLTYNFGGGVWAGLGGTFYSGGRTTVDGARNDDALKNSRFGAVLSLPIDRNNSLKLNASTGVTTRIGTSFDTIAVAWQYRWGGGL